MTHHNKCWKLKAIFIAIYDCHIIDDFVQPLIVNFVQVCDDFLSMNKSGGPLYNKQYHNVY